ncbi:unnamed protein product [Rotaria sp. Silwood2]|nr:unnamed protein product [Rotaria sp. Silwood2]CAF4243504.1 unnamed protein product [Rotaria sp. Silwood2]
MTIEADIMGLGTDFFLSESSYYVTIIDEHNRPNSENGFNRNELSCHDTLFDSCDARHIFITKTISKAVFYRIDSLTKIFSKFWRIVSDQFNDREKLWIDIFSELIGYPELFVNLFNVFM